MAIFKKFEENNSTHRENESCNFKERALRIRNSNNIIFRTNNNDTIFTRLHPKRNIKLEQRSNYTRDEHPTEEEEEERNNLQQQHRRS